MWHDMHSVIERRPARAAWTTLVAAALALPIAAQAQMGGPRLQLLPQIGAFVPTGNQGHMFSDAVMVGGQAMWALSPTWALTAGYQWSPSRDRTTTQASNKLFTGSSMGLNVQQGDIGIEARLRRPGSSGWSAVPYVGVGGGVRHYAYSSAHEVSVLVGKSGANAGLEYGAAGLELTNPSDPVGLRLQVRDDVTQFKGTYDQFASSQTQNDVMLSAGLAFRF
jgi:hypothetical protein